MSLATWYLLLVKALQVWRVRRQAAAVLQAFWSAPAFEEAVTTSPLCGCPCGLKNRATMLLPLAVEAPPAPPPALCQTTARSKTELASTRGRVWSPASGNPDDRGLKSAVVVSIPLPEQP